MEYINRNKLFAAQEEVKEKGGDVTAIYIRMGGLIRGEEVAVEAPKAEKQKKSKKK